MKQKIMVGLSLVLLSYSFINVSQGQSIDKQVKVSNNKAETQTNFHSDLVKYFNAYNNEKWREVISMMYPEIFEIISKEQMIELFTQMGGLGLKTKTDYREIASFSDTLTEAGIRYCRIDYTADLHIKLSGVMLENIEQLKEGYKSNYNAKNIHNNAQNDGFDMDVTKSMIAISKSDSDEWKYLEYEDQENSMAKQLIPAKVIMKLEESISE